MTEGDSLKTPKNLSDYVGKFVVFFSDVESPEVIFSTPIADEAYKKAEEITEQSKRQPVVMRVQENLQNNIAQLLATRAHAQTGFLYCSNRSIPALFRGSFL